MKLLPVLFLFMLRVPPTIAQDRLLTRNGAIAFYSHATLENIEANTQTAVSILDKTTGRIEFSVLIRSFTFRKALMQEHFNENYLESDKFPKSTFVGQIEDVSRINLDKVGDYAVKVVGQLTIHGVTQTVKVPAALKVQNEIIIAKASFKITLSDYNISIPAIVKDKLSEQIEITLNLEYEN